MTRTPPENKTQVLLQAHGVLVLNKPTGPTSTACLERIKKGLGQKKIGHAGTLDPLATGVLLVLLGKATKLASYLQEGGKTYAGALELGRTTDTYDSQGETLTTAPWEGLRPDDVAAAITDWSALTEQEVPKYAAAKHKGTPLYKLAREGKETPVKTKPINIARAECLGVDLPHARFRVECGAGTYVRSLVHSLGTRLGCGAVLTELIRERSHPYGLEDAHDLEALLGEPERFHERVIPLAKALPHWPAITLTERQAALVKNGAALDYTPGAPGMSGTGPGLDPGLTEAGVPHRRAVFLDPQGRTLALVEAKLRDGKPVWAVLRGL